MRVLWIAAPILAAALFAGGDQPSAPAGIHRFPSVESSNLEKRAVKLPQDFAGERNLVLIAFQRGQQKDVDTWLREMKQFEEADSALRYYELPVISHLNAFTRWCINNGMRGGVSTHEQRERTITLFLDKEPFRTVLGLPDEKRIYALLLDREGNVIWRAEGTYDQAKGSSLMQTLQRLNHTH